MKAKICFEPQNDQKLNPSDFTSLMIFAINGAYFLAFFLFVLVVGEVTFSSGDFSVGDLIPGDFGLTTFLIGAGLVGLFIGIMSIMIWKIMIFFRNCYLYRYLYRYFYPYRYLTV